MKMQKQTLASRPAAAAAVQANRRPSFWIYLGMFSFCTFLVARILWRETETSITAVMNSTAAASVSSASSREDEPETTGASSGEDEPETAGGTIALLGERNSGTTWMLKELHRCYNQTFTVLNHMTRHKHYFQYDDGEPHGRTFVVSEFRDPYQWVLAMVEKPRRCPAHRAMDWNTFVNTPWTTERAASDRQFAKFANTTERVCQYHFRYDEVVSCNGRPPPDEYVVYKDKHRNQEQSVPIYEMNPRTLKPYNNVVEMRADKIRNHAFEVKEFPFVEDVVVVLYEDLLAKGTKEFLDQMTKVTGVQPHCDPTPPQPERPKRPLPEGFKEWMDAHVDWETEALIGYSKA